MWCDLRSPGCTIYSVTAGASNRTTGVLYSVTKKIKTNPCCETYCCWPQVSLSDSVSIIIILSDSVSMIIILLQLLLKNLLFVSQNKSWLDC